MTNVEAQSRATMSYYEKKIDTNPSDTILEIKDLITAQKTVTFTDVQPYVILMMTHVSQNNS